MLPATIAFTITQILYTSTAIRFEKLTDEQRALYDIICEQEGIRPDTLYEAYCERVGDPRTRRTVRNHLKKMRRYNLVEVEGRGKARSYLPVE